MTTTCRDAERGVAILIDETNRIHAESPLTPWGYEPTVQIHNIGIVATESSKTLLVNPSWLRFVVEVDDFQACVADEIVAWYLIQDLTGTQNGLPHTDRAADSTRGKDSTRERVWTLPPPPVTNCEFLSCLDRCCYSGVVLPSIRGFCEDGLRRPLHPGEAPVPRDRRRCDDLRHRAYPLCPVGAMRSSRCSRGCSG